MYANIKQAEVTLDRGGREYTTTSTTLQDKAELHPVCQGQHTDAQHLQTGQLNEPEVQLNWMIKPSLDHFPVLYPVVQKGRKEFPSGLYQPWQNLLPGTQPGGHKGLDRPPRHLLARWEVDNHSFSL